MNKFRQGDFLVSFLPLIGEVSSDWRVGIAVAISGAVGGAVTPIVKFLWDRFKERTDEAKQEKQGIVEHQKQYIKQLEDDAKERDGKEDRTEKRLFRYIVLITAMRTHIGAMESLLRDKKAKFEPFKEPKFMDDEILPPPPSPSTLHRVLAPPTNDSEKNDVS